MRRSEPPTWTLRRVWRPVLELACNTRATKAPSGSIAAHWKRAWNIISWAGRRKWFIGALTIRVLFPKTSTRQFLKASVARQSTVCALCRKLECLWPGEIAFRYVRQALHMRKASAKRSGARHSMPLRRASPRNVSASNQSLER